MSAGPVDIPQIMRAENVMQNTIREDMSVFEVETINDLCNVLACLVYWDSIDDEFVCNLCGQRFYDWDGFWFHLVNEHDRNTKIPTVDPNEVF